MDGQKLRDELSHLRGLILKGEKIVIPKTMRQNILSLLHVGHMGIEKTRMRARDVIFWPGLSQDIAVMTSGCSICQERQFANPKEPMISHGIPCRPWDTVGTDLFDFERSKFIVVVDYYSRYFEVERLRDTKTSTVTHKLKAIFARHGIPVTVVSDNGPQYASAEFAQFAKGWGFQHVTSSPQYPQSNWLAEKTVQTVKRLLDKAKANGKDPYLSILEY